MWINKFLIIRQYYHQRSILQCVRQRKSIDFHQILNERNLFGTLYTVLLYKLVQNVINFFIYIIYDGHFFHFEGGLGLTSFSYGMTERVRHEQG